MELTLTETKRGNKAVIMDGFMYSLKKETQRSMNWQCTNRQCTGKITTSLDVNEVLHADTCHNHAKDEEKLHIHCLRQACKRKAGDDLSERPRKIIMKEAAKLNTETVPLTGVQSSRRAIWNERRKKLHPKLSSNLDEARGHDKLGSEAVERFTVWATVKRKAEEDCTQKPGETIRSEAEKSPSMSREGVSRPRSVVSRVRGKYKSTSVSSYQDTKRLILEIKKRRILWDVNHGSYKHNGKRNVAWAEVSQIIRPDFNVTSSDVVKQQIIHELQNRWKSVRDAFNRNRRLMKRKPQSMFSGKKYLFADLLGFIPHTMARREACDDHGTKSQPDQNPVREFQDCDGEEEDEGEEDESGPNAVTVDSGEAFCQEPSRSPFTSASSKPAQRAAASPSTQRNLQRKKSRDASDVEERMLALMERFDDRDPDKDFFNSLLPSVRHLSEDEKLEFRSQVIQLLQRINSQRLSCPPQPVPEQPVPEQLVDSKFLMSQLHQGTSMMPNLNSPPPPGMAPDTPQGHPTSSSPTAVA